MINSESPQTPETIRAELDRQVVTSQGYTRGQLCTAFDAVKNPENWKLPIDARIRPVNAEVTREAVIFFTGSVPTMKLLKSGELRVRAAGYYKTIGA